MISLFQKLPFFYMFSFIRKEIFKIIIHVIKLEWLLYGEDFQSD